MTDVHIVNTDVPKNITLLLQQKNKSDNYTESTKDFYLKKIFEPNKLSDEDIKNLCLDYYKTFIASDSKIKTRHIEVPKINIIKDLIILQNNFFSLNWNKKMSELGKPSAGYNTIFNYYIKKTDVEIQEANFPIQSFDILPEIYKNMINYRDNIGGCIHDSMIDYRLYQINFCKQKLSKKNAIFWDWYKRTFDVVAIYYYDVTNNFEVIKKPDEWRLENNNQDLYFRYGEKEKFFINGIAAPKWFYTTPVENLKAEDYLLLMNNVDLRTEFVRRVGIDKLVDLGSEIDTYENYPDNEMWAKSEYKIIDMSQIIPPPKRINSEGQETKKIAARYTYAPFLYMKNQTTGVYHLEGLHPSCRNLYDALKMRYNGLNIKDFEIKDIK